MTNNTKDFLFFSHNLLTRIFCRILLLALHKNYDDGKSNYEFNISSLLFYCAIKREQEEHNNIETAIIVI